MGVKCPVGHTAQVLADATAFAASSTVAGRGGGSRGWNSASDDTRNEGHTFVREVTDDAMHCGVTGGSS